MKTEQQIKNKAREKKEYTQSDCIDVCLAIIQSHIQNLATLDSYEIIKETNENGVERVFLICDILYETSSQEFEVTYQFEITRDTKDRIKRTINRGTKSLMESTNLNV